MLEQPNTSTDNSPILKTPIQTSPAIQSDDNSRFLIQLIDLFNHLARLGKGNWKLFKKFIQQRKQKTLHLILRHVMTQWPSEVQIPIGLMLDL